MNASECATLFLKREFSKELFYWWIAMAKGQE